MRSIFKSTKFLFFIVLLLPVLMVQTSCQTQDEPLEALKSSPESQLRMAPEWSGEVAIFIDHDHAHTLSEVSAMPSAVKPGQAVVLLQAEHANRISYQTIDNLIAEISAIHGTVTGYTIRSADENSQLRLDVDERVDMGKKFEIGSNDLKDDIEIKDPVPLCGQDCSKFSGIQLLFYVGGAYSFAGNCPGAGQGGEVVQDALRSCFATEVLAANKRCPNGCYCDYDDADTVNHTKACYANGATFTSDDGMCVLTITGQITVTAAITTDTGKCKSFN